MSARRPLLLPFLPLYTLGLSLKNLLFDRRLLSVKTLPKPVISVGSLSAGGAGKTPVVVALARLLTQHGIPLDILTRGYKRDATTVEQVDPSGSPDRYGDEPLEMAAVLPHTRIFVSADRFAAGQLAERRGAVQLHLLDDGFQHRKLARALDMVLLTTEDVADHLIPAGNLREPLAALARADVVILRDDEAEALAPTVQAHSKADLWLIRRAIGLPAGHPLRPIAFCGIARPAGFFTMLSSAGCTPADTIAFPDHHAYTAADMTLLLGAAKLQSADGFVTTAKDAVKLTPAWVSHLEQAGKLTVATLTVSLVDPEQALTRLSQVLALA